MSNRSTAQLVFEGMFRSTLWKRTNCDDHHPYHGSSRDNRRLRILYVRVWASIQVNISLNCDQLT
jgi:hypothetical protein